jgi:hypothetical protein
MLLSTLFSNTLSLRFSLNVSDQVSHPHAATDKVIVLVYLNPYSANVENMVSQQMADGI